eukprot:CAMPEP_0174374744 /NCGR_PEP_ID=MMETSP0811_2-20130205/112030_1 /TAXON_ID=73025 ORGANISM="Eutreptiella gymnastica-like, Strain CCMP1594" /NCGR_SAMPLE_ID=MMETSP0811_2 /ASSEMBLY_ACC=CAM_ASM_000667 /LENGTH=241 /DNA_ID=CAMNT_0015524313 /DNA_START=76 /DNA_END=801 /DNA_ORIENTATION=+
MPLHIHVVQHAKAYTGGMIEDWAHAHRHKYTSTHLWVSDAHLPAVNQFDWLVLVGGPLPAAEGLSTAWVLEELTLVKEAIQQDKVVIGMGQGAQLIASALGAGVVQNEQGPEIGWFPVKFTDVARHPRVFPFLPDELVVFHGHANTFQLPLGAKLLASSSACHNQAFLYENRVLAMQFHLEWTEEDVQNVLPQVQNTIQPGKYMQSVSTILAGKDVYVPLMREALNKILDRMVEFNDFLDL